MKYIFIHLFWLAALILTGCGGGINFVESNRQLKAAHVNWIGQHMIHHSSINPPTACYVPNGSEITQWNATLAGQGIFYRDFFVDGFDNRTFEILYFEPADPRTGVGLLRKSPRYTEKYFNDKVANQASIDKNIVNNNYLYLKTYVLKKHREGGLEVHVFSTSDRIVNRFRHYLSDAKRKRKQAGDSLDRKVYTLDMPCGPGNVNTYQLRKEYAIYAASEDTVITNTYSFKYATFTSLIQASMNKLVKIKMEVAQANGREPDKNSEVPTIEIPKEEGERNATQKDAFVWFYAGSTSRIDTNGVSKNTVWDEDLTDIDLKDLSDLPDSTADGRVYDKITYVRPLQDVTLRAGRPTLRPKGWYKGLAVGYVPRNQKMEVVAKAFIPGTNKTSRIWLMARKPTWLDKKSQ